MADRLRRYLLQLQNTTRGRFLVAVILVAILLRAAAVFLLRDPSLGPHASAGQDGVDFDLLAWQLANGHGFSWADGTPTAYRAVGFPFALSLVYRAFGHSYPAAYLFFVIVGVAAVVAIYASSRALLGELGGRIAAVLAAVHPILIYLTTEFLSEELFVLLAALALWAALAMHRRLLGAAVAGAFLSAAMLVRPQAIFLMPAFLALYVMRDRRLLAAAPLVGVFTAGQLPWIIRNLRVDGGFVLVAANGGLTLLGSNNDLVLSDHQYRGSWVPPSWLPDSVTEKATANELANDRNDRHLAALWVREHPTRFVRLVGWKLWNLFTPWDTTSGNRRFQLITGLAGLPILVLIIVGIGVAARKKLRDGRWLLLHFAVAGVLAMTVIFYGSPRLRDSFAPFLLPYAALALIALAGLPFHDCAGNDVARVTRAPRTPPG